MSVRSIHDEAGEVFDRPADIDHIQFSGAFDDPVKLIATCKRMGLEGIVSKKRDAPYRPGPTLAWPKTKTASWRAANRDRFELLHKPK